MIEVKGITKYYGEFRALDDVSFSVGKGEVLGFLGPNGAGKSTTMKVLTTFISASEGTASVCGHDVHVDLYGGRDNVCGSVRFTFPDASDRRRNVTQLREWQRDAVPVALLAYGDTITLLSERALLDRCLQQT